MLPASKRRRSFLLASAAALLAVPAAAQTSSQSQLPPVTVDAPQQIVAADGAGKDRLGLAVVVVDDVGYHDRDIVGAAAAQR